MEVSSAMPSQVQAWFESGGNSILALLKPYLPEDIMAHLAGQLFERIRKVMPEVERVDMLDRGTLSIPFPEGDAIQEIPEPKFQEIVLALLAELGISYVVQDVYGL